MKKNKIEFYHLGKSDALDCFRQRGGKQWWPDSSQYQRGVMDGLLHLHAHKDPRLLSAFRYSPPKVRKRFVKVHGDPTGKYEIPSIGIEAVKPLVKKNVFQRLLAWLFKQ